MFAATRLTKNAEADSEYLVRFKTAMDTALQLPGVGGFGSRPCLETVGIMDVKERERLWRWNVGVTIDMALWNGKDCFFDVSGGGMELVGVVIEKLVERGWARLMAKRRVLVAGYAGEGLGVLGVALRASELEGIVWFVVGPEVETEGWAEKGVRWCVQTRDEDPLRGLKGWKGGVGEGVEGVSCRASQALGGEERKLQLKAGDPADFVVVINRCDGENTLEGLMKRPGEERIVVRNGNVVATRKVEAWVA